MFYREKGVEKLQISYVTELFSKDLNNMFDALNR